MLRIVGPIPIVVVVGALSSAGCFVQDELNQGTARLAVLAAGQVVAFATSNQGCALASPATLLLDIDNIASDDHGGIKASWDIDQCHVGSDHLVTTQTDCVGDAVFAQGNATVTASQIVDVGSLLPPAINESHAVQLAVDADVSELTTFAVQVGQPQAKLTFHHGKLSAELEPALGESKSSPGTYSVPTPVVRMSHVRLTDAALTIVAEGQTVDVNVDDSDITAVSGPFDGVENVISGFIDIGGEHVDVTGALQPDFDLQKFDASYACTSDLAGPVR
ncbi:MAG TPA: hypothetical protein VGO62_16990 [Myxococcota bacterium]|jgi:hypothetical protein